MWVKGAGSAASEPRSTMLSESDCAREEETEISAGLRLTWILLCSSLLTDVGLEDPFPRSKGKPLILEHLRQAW